MTFREKYELHRLSHHRIDAFVLACRPEWFVFVAAVAGLVAGLLI